MPLLHPLLVVTVALTRGIPRRPGSLLLLRNRWVPIGAFILFGGPEEDLLLGADGTGAGGGSGRGKGFGSWPWPYILKLGFRDQ